jgi:hypothetical protein
MARDEKIAAELLKGVFKAHSREHANGSKQQSQAAHQDSDQLHAKSQQQK